MSDILTQEQINAERHQQFLASVRARKGVGEIGIAGAIASQALSCVGGACGRYLPQGVDVAAAIKRANDVATYCGDQFQIEEKATGANRFRELLPDGIEAPKHTAMIIRHVLTSPREDRDKDVLKTEGAMVDPRMALLWQHAPMLPIGKLCTVLEQSKEVLRMATALLDLNDLTSDAVKLVEAGALRFSHGFRVFEYEQRKAVPGDMMPPGFEVLKYEIMEESLVSVPSNVDAIVEMYSKGALTSDPYRELAKRFYEVRPKSWAGIAFAEKEPEKAPENKATKASPVMRKLFDVANEWLEPANTEIEWAARFLGCGVKEVTLLHTHVGHVMRGGFFRSLEFALSGLKVADTRNMDKDGTERPPVHEQVQIKSSERATFLIEGIRFFLGDGFKLVCRTYETYSGQGFLFYAENAEKAQAVVNNAWEELERNNPLKGEAFSLTGGFIERKNIRWPDVFLDEPTEKALKRTTRIINEKAGAAANRGVILMGPPGCLHGDTLIYDPVDRTTSTVSEREQSRKPFHVWARSKGGDVVIAAVDMAWKYEPAEMLRFTFASGRQITVTKGHRFWDGESYVCAQQIAERHRESGACHLPSISESDLEAPTRDALHSWRKLQDSMGRCFEGSYPCGGQPQCEGESGQASLLLQGDVRLRSRASWPMDGQAGKDTNIDQRESGLRSTLGCSILTEPLTGCESPLHIAEEGGERDGGSCLIAERTLLRLRRSRRGLTTPRFSQLSSDLGSAWGLQCSVGWTHDYITQDEIVKVEDAGVHSYYDFHVPAYNNYWAEGCFHHNTGKTLSARVMMNETQCTFIWVSAKDFYRAGSFYAFSGALELARSLTPAIVLYEDVDNWITDYTVDLLKGELDGLVQTTGLTTILTTNFPDRLPAALIDRPGRFHDVLEIHLPTRDVRLRMLQKWAEGASLEAIAKMADDLDGYSGAHLYELCHFAKVLKDEDDCSIEDALVKAFDKVKEQRERINQSQLAGSNYHPGRRSKSWFGERDGSQIDEPILPAFDQGEQPDPHACACQKHSEKHAAGKAHNAAASELTLLVKLDDSMSMIGPMPGEGEAQDAFMARCQIDPTMMDEYPTESNRLAACKLLWGTGDGTDGKGAGEGGKPEGTKAGRVLSAKNLQTMQDVHDDLVEVCGMDKVPRPAMALCERSHKKLADVIESAGGSGEEEKATPAAELSPLKMAALALAGASPAEIVRIKEAADAYAAATETQNLIEQLEAMAR